jgi:spermidine synthase
MAVVSAFAVFLSACLLFACQPMAGKAILPIFGGSPAVWTSCLVFFQAVLLLGYLYAHLIGRWPAKWQVLIHIAVLAIAGLVQRAINITPAIESGGIPHSIDGLFLHLFTFTFFPAFALSSTAPLIQRWFGLTGRNPYGLYAASNLGSFAGLLGYPFVIEPRIALGEQVHGWLVGYAITAAFIALAGFFAWRSHVPATTPTSATPWRWSWLLLAALPSSLLSSVTSHLTTDIAPVPLLWVVPLGLYLLTFVVAFGRWTERANRVAGRIMPMALCALAVALLSHATEPVVIVGSIHLLAFTWVALVCHGELNRTKPDAAGLTRFYLIVSLGGVLGGAFNAIAAPILFARLGPVEYPLAVCLAALVRPPAADGSRPTWIGRDDIKWLAGLAAIALALTLTVPSVIPIPESLDGVDAMLRRLARYGLTAGVPTVMAFALVRRPGRFAVALASLFMIGSLDPGQGRHLATRRSVLGTLHVTQSPDGRFTRIMHGTTLHGQQKIDERDRPTPLMYYHPTGPAGRMLNLWPRRSAIGAVGLGCGALAAYGRPGERWTFYELDPDVTAIAQDIRYFTFLATSRADVTIKPGDARRQLNDARDSSFDVLILDAFNSDSVPTHLLTREAFDLYFRKLKPDGVLLIHASNRYLDLPGLIARTCDGMALRRDFEIPTESQKHDGKFPSDWLIISRSEADLEPLKKDLRWQRLTPKPGPLWTDNFTDLIGIWKQTEE